MTLSPGTKLGRYEICSMIGAGGMGEVYRAHDAKLQREVAVKKLPADVSEDPARLQRFEQEAHAASQLNHPNILLIFDVGLHDGISFIVSELLKGDLWIYELGRNTPTRFTTDIEGDDVEWWPIWSPDGRRVVFATDIGGPPHLFQKGLSDTGGGEQLLPLSGIQVPNDWSADGRFILYEESGANNRMDLWVLPLFGERKPFAFLQTQFSETQAQCSPDGRWVAYVSDESGQPEVYVQSFEGSRERRRISNTGGAGPRWRRNGQELFFLSPDDKLVVVSVTVGTTFEAGEPKTLFRINSGVWQDYDVTADGQRFLSNNAAASPNSSPITVVLNWTADLKR